MNTKSKAEKRVWLLGICLFGGRLALGMTGGCVERGTGR